MRPLTSTLAGLALLFAVAAAPGVAGQSPGPLPFEPRKDSGASVTGAYEGWFQNPDGSYSLLIGYMNRNAKQTLDIPVGPNNRIEPGGPDRGQPTHFQPRRQWGVFVITVPKDFGKQKLTWTIVSNGQTTTIPLTLNDLWIVAPYKDAAVGNTPPTLKFEGGAAAHQGPPKGISASYQAAAGQPLTLTVRATDDAVRPPESRPATSGPATLRWSKYRGPGDVTFSNAAPEPDVRDGGTTTTTATFSAAGEYILRAQSNDATGEGGGGFQCCWTNAHVKVTVAPAPGS